ncbi:hypothetical protein [Sorangium sp. So ce1078]|uniref:hypothetical protein n=1 Tax=Sorangium sp. So ce1078 TaxID=3133329 RepID=UPI003F602B26
MRTIKLLVIAFALGACVVNSEQLLKDVMNGVQRRAALDLNCPQSEIMVQKLAGSSTYGARGCNQSASYVVLCRGTTDVENQCTYFMDSASVQQPAAPPASSGVRPPP